MEDMLSAQQLHSNDAEAVIGKQGKTLIAIEQAVWNPPTLLEFAFLRHVYLDPRACRGKGWRHATPNDQNLIVAIIDHEAVAFAFRLF